MQNELLKNIFASDTPQTKFIVGALEKLLGEKDTENVLMELMPQSPTTEKFYKDKPLSFYSGLGRAKLVLMFGLSESEVEEVFTALGVEETDKEKEEATAEIKAAEDRVNAGISKPVVQKEVAVTETAAVEDFSYAALIKNEKSVLFEMAKERGLDVSEDDRGQTLASQIAKFEKAKATE